MKTIITRILKDIAEATELIVVFSMLWFVGLKVFEMYNQFLDWMLALIIAVFAVLLVCSVTIAVVHRYGLCKYYGKITRE